MQKKQVDSCNKVLLSYSAAMSSQLLRRGSDPLPTTALPVDQTRSGSPRTGVWEAPVGGVECGLWQHTEGVSVDVEVHEVFVVLEGSAEIEIEGEGTLQVGPGDVVELAAGARTVWHVMQPLRKFWVALA